jgi:hypothetical protein
VDKPEKQRGDHQARVQASRYSWRGEWQEGFRPGIEKLGNWDSILDGGRYSGARQPASR